MLFAFCIAAADVNDVLVHQQIFKISSRRPKKREMDRSTIVLGESGKESGGVLSFIGAGAEEADPRTLSAGVPQDISVHYRVVRLHRKSAAAHCDDVTVACRGAGPGN
jgi:hypothetical protein